MDILNKDQCIIVIYDDGEENPSIDINKIYDGFNGKFNGYIPFIDDLNKLGIVEEHDEYIYYGEMNTNELVNTLL